MCYIMKRCRKKEAKRQSLGFHILPARDITLVATLVKVCSETISVKN